MKIERIDEKTVKCFLSNEELKEYDIEYQDFITRSEKAQEVVHDIMEQAAEEVGYVPPQYAFELQIMVVPDQGMVLTFSEKDPDSQKGSQQFKECLRDMKEMIQMRQKELEQTGKTPTKKGELLLKEEAVISFPRISSVMEFADILPPNLRVGSTLYQMNGEYYLLLQKGSASLERYEKICVRSLEYGTLHAAAEEMDLRLVEHGECLIEEKALNKLRHKNKKTPITN